MSSFEISEILEISQMRFKDEKDRRIFRLLSDPGVIDRGRLRPL